MSLCILFTVAASERAENRISCWKTSVELNKLRNRTMATTFHLWWTKFFGIFFNKLPEHFAVLMLFWCFGSNDKSCLTTYWPTQLHKTISTNNKITCFWRKKTETLTLCCSEKRAWPAHSWNSTYACNSNGWSIPDCVDVDRTERTYTRTCKSDIFCVCMLIWLHLHSCLRVIGVVRHSFAATPIGSDARRTFNVKL